MAQTESAPDDHDDESYDDDPSMIDVPQWLREVMGESAPPTPRRRRQMSYNHESLSQTLDKIEKSLSGQDWQEVADDLQAELDDVRDRVQAARAQGTHLAKAVDEDIQRLHHRIDAITQAGASKDHVRRQLKRLWEELQHERNEWKEG